jgi:uncharacterized protein with PIN domain
MSETKPPCCPLCHTPVHPDEELSLLFTEAEASAAQRAMAKSANIRVCPKCHILFFEDSQYDWLTSLTRGVRPNG